ncbi:hypothetical protein BC831DRAFT_112339 [Entophlyctis helioformis]|nr:hypothetical protein BC831DRAFT_112339 [Entophlyctis helioformis]
MHRMLSSRLTRLPVCPPVCPPARPLTAIVSWDIDGSSTYLLRCYSLLKPAPVCIDNVFSSYHAKAGEPLLLTVMRDATLEPLQVSVTVAMVRASVGKLCSAVLCCALLLCCPVPYRPLLCTSSSRLTLAECTLEPQTPPPPPPRLQSQGTSNAKFYDVPIMPPADAADKRRGSVVVTLPPTLAPGGYNVVLSAMSLPLPIWIDTPDANWTLTVDRDSDLGTVLPQPPQSPIGTGAGSGKAAAAPSNGPSGAEGTRTPVVSTSALGIAVVTVSMLGVLGAVGLVYQKQVTGIFKSATGAGNTSMLADMSAYEQVEFEFEDDALDGDEIIEMN